MKKRESFNVDEERLKEIMAHGTNDDGSLKVSLVEKKEEKAKPDIFPVVQEEAEECVPVSRKTARSGASLAEKIEKYRANYLNRKESVHRKQTYISYETYRRLARILPLLSEGMTVPAFLDNVLNHHLEQNQEELDEMVRSGTRNSR